MMVWASSGGGKKVCRFRIQFGSRTPRFADEVDRHRERGKEGTKNGS